MFVIKVNEEFKLYLKEIFNFIKPLFHDYSNILSDTVRNFLKKLNEVFILYHTNYRDEMNMVLVNDIYLKIGCSNLQ